MSRQAFNDYWSGQSIEPEKMAAQMGVTFSVDAATGREYAKMPTANYFGKLATKDRKGLALYVIDPASRLTLGQYQAMQQWAASGGPAKLQAQLAQSGPETAATAEGQTATAGSGQQDVDAGQTPEDAEAIATRDANVYGNLARKIGISPSLLQKLYAGFQGLGGGQVLRDGLFVRAEGATLEQNASAAQAYVIPGDALNAPAVVVNPHAYAYLRKLNVGLEGKHFRGIYLNPDRMDALKVNSATSLSGLSANAKASVDTLLQTLRDNPSARGGTILVRQGMTPWEHVVSIVEERVHDFQTSHRVPDDWLKRYPEAVRKAMDEMERQEYAPAERANEIGAKLLAGDRMGLSVRDANLLRGAYLRAIKDHHGLSGLGELPDLTDSLRRLNGQQF